MSDSCNVRVFCRFRPFNQREKDLGEDQGVEINIKPGQVEIVDPTTGRKRDFPMDHCFEGGCHQRDVFDTIALQSVEDIFEGFNGTIFAYGQTGSGKSWSMMGGDKRDADLKGIIPRSADAIFAKAAADQSGTVYSVACSYLQVYKEKIGDLLDPSKNNLQVREDPRSGVYVDGLTQAYVSSMDEVMGVLLKGDSSRAVAATNMNAVSSRSHSVFIVEVTQKTTEGGTKKGRLNLVDLAGSEKVGKTGASGNTLEEAKKINQSLSALGNVIKSLADGRGHVPYRDSKLTRILQEALGGNSKTSLLVAASPHLDNIEETLSTLRFAQRAKTIKNRVTVNEEKSVSELMAIIDQLKKQNEGLTTYVFSLETALKEAGIDPDTIRTVAAPDAFTSSGGGGGGTDAAPATMKTLELQAQIDKLNEICRIAKEDAEQARFELTEQQASIEAAYAEGRAAMEEKEVLVRQREGERAIVKKAMEELKSLQVQAVSKDAVIQKALAKMKELSAANVQARADQKAVQEERGALQDERSQMESKLKGLVAKIELLQNENAALSAAAATGQQPATQQVVVPVGAAPGTSFTAELPSGQTVTATVPPDFVPGQTVEVALPAVAAPPITAGGAPLTPGTPGAEDSNSKALWRRLDEQQLELDKALEESAALKKKERAYIAKIEEAEVTQKEVEDAHMQAVDDAKQHETQLVETRAAVERLEAQLTRMGADGAKVEQVLEQKESEIAEQAKLIQDLTEQAHVAAEASTATASSNMVKTLPQALPEGEPPPPIDDRAEDDDGVMVPRGIGGSGIERTRSVPAARTEKKKKKWWGGDSSESDSGGGGAAKPSFWSGVGKSIAGIFGAVEEEDGLTATPQDPLPAMVTVVDPANKDSAGNSARCPAWDPSKNLALPGASTTVAQECEAMEKYLNQMHDNLECLAKDYDNYIAAVGGAATAAEQLTTTMFNFAGVSSPAKIFFQLIAKAHVEQKTQLEQSQAHIETLIRSFWISSDDAAHIKSGQLQKIARDASTTYNVALARALANPRPDKYEAALNGSQGAKVAVAKYNVARWDYVSALESLVTQRELEMHQLFNKFIDAQLATVAHAPWGINPATAVDADAATVEIAQMDAKVEDARATAQEKARRVMAFCGSGGALQQYRTRLGLAVERVTKSSSMSLPGVQITPTLAEGLVFMCPAVRADKEEKLRKSGKAPKRSAWIPTWCSLGLQGGVFRFDAEWQGPIPGMDKLLKECYELQASMQLAHCNLAGLDASTPVGGMSASTGRLFLFEVQSMSVDGFSEPKVYVFQALSPTDMSAWRSAFATASSAGAARQVPVPGQDDSGGDAGISGPLHLMGTAAAVDSPPTARVASTPPAVGAPAGLDDEEEEEEDDDDDDDKL